DPAAFLSCAAKIIEMHLCRHRLGIAQNLSGGHDQAAQSGRCDKSYRHDATPRSSTSALGPSRKPAALSGNEINQTQIVIEVSMCHSDRAPTRTNARVAVRQP